MHYIIGTESCGWLTEKVLNTTPNNDSFEFFSRSIEDTIDEYNRLFSSRKINCTIRGEFQTITAEDCEILQKYGIHISLIANSKDDLDSKINVLKSKCLKFELVFTDKFVKAEGIDCISQLLADSVDIRICNTESTPSAFFQMMREIQERSFEKGGTALFSALDQSSDYTPQVCMFAGTDPYIHNFYKQVKCEGKGVIEINQDMESYFLLSSVAAVNKNAFHYIRNNAIKRIQSKILQISLPEKQKNEEPENSYDVVFVYANRVRGIAATPFPPGAPYYLSTIAIENGFSSKVIECSENSFEEEFSRINDRVKIVGFYCACDNEIMVTNMIKYIKSISPNIIVIVGGPQAVVLNENFFIRSKADIVSVGEGEQTTIELLEYYINGRGAIKDIKGIKYYINNKLYKTEEREPIKDLDAYPFTKLRRKDVAKYSDPSRIFILTGRGCPNRCTFCYEGANSRKLRYRSMDRVFEEIDYLLNEFPLANKLHIFDDTFTCNPKRVYDFCDRIKEIRKKRKIEWVCEVHINTVYNKPELLQYMVDSGLSGFQIGLESGSDEVLKAYKKNTTSQMIKSFFDMCSTINGNISIEGNIIFGGPFESKNTILESMNLCRYILEKGRGTLELQTCCFSPLPNTDITLNPQKYGLEISNDDVDTTIHALSQIVTSSRFLSKDEIRVEKENFDKEIDAIYSYQTLRLTTEQVLSLWNKNTNSFNIRSRWGMKLNSLEHFVNFAMAMTFDNPKPLHFDANVYPIRTFESMQYLKDVFESNGFVFSERQYEELKLSNGRFDIQQLSEHFETTIEQIKDDFEQLNQLCLVYYSRC